MEGIKLITIGGTIFFTCMMVVGRVNHQQRMFS